MRAAFAVNVLWNVNPVIRLGAKWLRVFNSYNGRGTVGTDSNGTLDQYRGSGVVFCLDDTSCRKKQKNSVVKTDVKGLVDLATDAIS